MSLDPLSLVVGVLIALVVRAALSRINFKAASSAKAATFPEGYIPPEGLVPTVSATYGRLRAYAITKGCRQGAPPDKDGEASLFWPTDSENFRHYIGTCDNKPNAPAALEIDVWADMSVQDEQRAIRAIDQLDNALNEAATFWFKNNRPNLRRINGTRYFDTRVGDDYLDFSFIHEVHQRTQKLHEAEAQRVAEARRKAAEPGPGAAKGVSGGITCEQ